MATRSQVASQLDRDLEDDERVGPRREAARPTEAVELAGHRHHGVVGGLPADVVELGAADLGVEVAAATCLAAGGPEQQVVEALEREVALASRSPQPLDPGARSGVELLRHRAGGDLRLLRSHRQEERSHVT